MKRPRLSNREGQRLRKKDVDWTGMRNRLAEAPGRSPVHTLHNRPAIAASPRALSDARFPRWTVSCRGWSPFHPNFF